MRERRNGSLHRHVLHVHHQQTRNHSDIAHAIGKKAPPFSDRGDHQPATAGPTIRAPFNIEEFNAIAFGRSFLGTMSATNVWRVGISIEFTTPSRIASTNTCQIRIVPVSVSPANRKRQDHRGSLRANNNQTTVPTIRKHSSERG